MENIENPSEMLVKAKQILLEQRNAFYSKVQTLGDDVNIVGDLDNAIDLSNAVETTKMSFDELVKFHAKNRDIITYWKIENKPKLTIDFWNKEKFELFFENEFAILLYSGWSRGEKGIDATHSVFNRLREVYNERFKPEIEEINLKNSLSTATQKVQFMYELGIFDLLEGIPELNGNKTKIAQVIAAFTGLNPHTIRQPYRAILDDKNTSKYNISNSKNEDALNAVYNEIGLKRKVRIKGDTKGK
jgi:hypothetical protein